MKLSSVTAAACLALLMAARAESADSGVVTLESWTKEAMRTNPEIAAALARWRAAREDATSAGGWEDPMFGVDLMRDGSTSFTDTSKTEWMLSQKFPMFGQRSARRRAGSYEAEAAGLEYLEMRREVGSKVAAAFWDMWYAARTVKNMEANLSLLSETEKSVRARYESSEGGQADILRIGVEKSKATVELETVRREVQTAEVRINALLNAPYSMARDILSVPLPAMDKLPMQEDVIKNAIAYCCVLQAKERKIDAAGAMVRAARLDRLPEVELRVAARQPRGSGAIEEYDTFVGINLPWVWSGKYRSALSGAKFARAAAVADRDAERNMLVTEAMELHASADDARRRLSSYEDDVLPKAEKLVDSTRSGYLTGKATLMELTESMRMLLDSRVARDRARADYGKKSVGLHSMIDPYDSEEQATGAVRSTGKEALP